MFVLGIDPGLSRCGYCVLAPPRAGSGRGGGLAGRGVRAVALGVLTTPPTAELPARLAELQHELRALVAQHPPAVLAVERVLFQVNARTAMGTAMAAGLAMAEAASAGAQVVQYSPNQVKQAVAGDGAAGKDQVQRMVQTLLGLDRPPRPADAADAAALALCHVAHAPMGRAVAAAAAREGVGS